MLSLQSPGVLDLKKTPRKPNFDFHDLTIERLIRWIEFIPVDCVYQSYNIHKNGLNSLLLFYNQIKNDMWHITMRS